MINKSKRYGWLVGWLYKLWRRTLLQGCGCEGLALRLNVWSQSLSILWKIGLHFQRTVDFGCCLLESRDLNSGVTWIGELMFSSPKMGIFSSRFFRTSHVERNSSAPSLCSVWVSGNDGCVLSPYWSRVMVDPELYSELSGESWRSGCLSNEKVIQSKH